MSEAFMWNPWPSTYSVRRYHSYSDVTVCACVSVCVPVCVCVPVSVRVYVCALMKVPSSYLNVMTCCFHREEGHCWVLYDA